MKNKKEIKAVCFGEVLWDIFPTHKKIGGAPLNVALRLNSMGVTTTMVSRVGKDENGEDILAFLSSQEVTTDFIQVANEYKTGVVNVMINEKGNASYDIAYPSAWDKIEKIERMDKLINEADVFVFGSLASRDEVSRETLFSLLEKAKYKVLDANLRAPYYTKEVIYSLMLKADFI